MNLNAIKLGHSPLTDTIFLYRHGKDPSLALDKREAEADNVGQNCTRCEHDYECHAEARSNDEAHRGGAA